MLVDMRNHDDLGKSKKKRKMGRSYMHTIRMNVQKSKKSKKRRELALVDEALRNYWWI